MNKNREYDFSEVSRDHGGDAVMEQRGTQVWTQQVHVLQVGGVTPGVRRWAWPIQETHSRPRRAVRADESVDRTDVFLSRLVGVARERRGAALVSALDPAPLSPSPLSHAPLSPSPPLPVQSDHLVALSSFSIPRTFASSSTFRLQPASTHRKRRSLAWLQERVSQRTLASCSRKSEHTST